MPRTSELATNVKFNWNESPWEGLSLQVVSYNNTHRLAMMPLREPVSEKKGPNWASHLRKKKNKVKNATILL